MNFHIERFELFLFNVTTNKLTERYAFGLGTPDAENIQSKENRFYSGNYEHFLVKVAIVSIFVQSVWLIGFRV